ncbi:MAG: hypothetical protein A3K76_03000 [Euryarchaeota archaeon RBG_13_57_23]|nr:MAG: hypothetical protein A3K76_03000 [Euryarchaeota archaeon RBG_13_57_23]
MRVAMLTYSTRPRGGVVHALKLAERLHALGLDVTLYSLARKDDPSSSAGYFRSVSVPFEIFSYEWHADLITRLGRMIEAYSASLPKDMDIYHAQDCIGGTALARMKSKGEIAAPIFRTIHHVDDFAEPRLFEFEKRAVAQADHRFVVSRYWQKALKDDYGYDSIISYNGIDVSDFSGLPDRKSMAPSILFVGGLEPRKGLEYLVHALEYVVEKFPDAHLIAIAKTGFRGTDEVGWFKALANRLGLTDNIEFHESVTQEKLREHYSECDLLVLPSKTEGWGLALMEAMACGKPVVASRVGGVPELVRDGVDGLLVDAGDVRALSSAIVRLLEDDGLRAKMGKAGALRVQDFSWDSTAKVVLQAYESALTQSSRIRS